MQETWLDSWVGKIPWRGKGNPFQYSCPENSMDRWVWWATVHGVAKSRPWLSTREKAQNVAYFTGGMNDLSWGLSMSCPLTSWMCVWITCRACYNTDLQAPSQSVQEKSPDCSFCQLLWYKHFHHGQFQVISIRWDVHDQPSQDPREGWFTGGEQGYSWGFC